MSDLEDYNNIIIDISNVEHDIHSYRQSLSDMNNRVVRVVDIPHMREIYNSFESERNKFTCAISDLELKLVKLNAARNIAAQCLEDSGHEWRMNYVTKKFEWVHKDTINQQLKEIDDVLPIDSYDITSEEYIHINRFGSWNRRYCGIMKRACYIEYHVFIKRANVIYANYKRVQSEINFACDNTTITIYGHKYTFKKPWRS